MYTRNSVKIEATQSFGLMKSEDLTSGIIVLEIYLCIQIYMVGHISKSHSKKKNKRKRNLKKDNWV